MNQQEYPENNPPSTLQPSISQQAHSSQEYLAALEIDDWHFFLNHVPNNPFQGTYRIFEPQWKQVILLWLGRTEVKKEQKEEFITALVDFQDKCKNFYKYQAYFLAVEGIAEFRDCDKADEIIANIVNWIFSDSQWDTLVNTFFALRNPFFVEDTEELMAVLAKTHRPKAINFFIQLIRSNSNNDNRLYAALILLKIDSSNPDAIALLLELTHYSQEPDIRRRAAGILGEVELGNSDAIEALINLVRYCRSEDICIQAAVSLGTIDPGNPNAIAFLVKLIRDSRQNIAIRKEAADSLEKIAPGNPDTIAFLVELIRDSQNDSFIRKQAAKSLGKIAPGNPDAVAFLVELIRDINSENYLYICIQILPMLGEVGAGNPDAIAVLVESIRNSKDDHFIPGQAAEILGKIAPGNPDAIAVLVELIRDSQNEDTSVKAAHSLWKINPTYPNIIEHLVKLICKSRNKDIRMNVAADIIDSLTLDQMVKVVTAIKPSIQLLPNFELSTVLWKYAKKMPYSSFYQAWHQRR